MMRTMRFVVIVASGIALVSCATTPTESNAPPRGPTQDLVLRTDPPDAACSILRGGVVVASVTNTPGTAAVPRPVWPFIESVDHPDDWAPIEVVCSKQGYLETRRIVGAEHAIIVERDEGVTREHSRPSAVSATGATVGAAAAGWGVSALGAGAGALATASAVVPPLAVAAVVIMIAGGASQPKDVPPYAYRALPELILTPATFDSENACDAFFEKVKAKLESVADAQRRRINEECHPWPCGPADAVCTAFACEVQRERVDAKLKGEFERIFASRAHVRIVTP